MSIMPPELAIRPCGRSLKSSSQPQDVPTRGSSIPVVIVGGPEMCRSFATIRRGCKRWAGSRTDTLPTQSNMRLSGSLLTAFDPT